MGNTNDMHDDDIEEAAEAIVDKIPDDKYRHAVDQIIDLLADAEVDADEVPVAFVEVVEAALLSAARCGALIGAVWALEAGEGS